MWGRLLSRVILCGMSNDSRKLRPRFLRFNLRTLIVVTTVICICLGVIAIRAQNKRQAIADEKRADELVGILYWGRKDASSKIDDSSLALISRFPQLKVDRLFLGNTQVTDAGLVHLKRDDQAKRACAQQHGSHGRRARKLKRDDQAKASGTQQHASHRRRVGAPERYQSGQVTN